MVRRAEEGSLAQRPAGKPRSKGRREVGRRERHTEQEAEHCGSRHAEELRSARHEEVRSRARPGARGLRSVRRHTEERSLEAEDRCTDQNQFRCVHRVHREICRVIH